MKNHLLPVVDFKYQEILLICNGHNMDGIYSHAGAFIRREFASRNKYGKRAEVSYYDSNLNNTFSIGGQTVG